MNRTNETARTSEIRTSEIQTSIRLDFNIVQISNVPILDVDCNFFSICNFFQILFFIVAVFIFLGIMAGELKHGPLALVDNEMPMIMIVTRDPTYQVQFFFLQAILGIGFGPHPLFLTKPPFHFNFNLIKAFSNENRIG